MLVLIKVRREWVKEGYNMPLVHPLVPYRLFSRIHILVPLLPAKL